MIEYCRGSPVLQKFFIEAFDGVLITDFRAAYDSVDAADRQKCLLRLAGKLEKVDLRNDSAWQAFAKKLRRLLRDGIRLRKRSDFTPKRCQSRIDRLNQRLGVMAVEEHGDADTRRLTKRLRRYAGRSHERLPHTEAPRAPPHQDHRPSPPDVPHHRKPPTATRRNHCTRLISYDANDDMPAPSAWIWHANRQDVEWRCAPPPPVPRSPDLS